MRPLSPTPGRNRAVPDGVETMMLDLLVLSLAGCCATAQPAAPPPSRVRTVPCEEVIDHVGFPYAGGGDPRFLPRLVLAAVSAPGPFVPQTTPTESRPWTYFAKWGMVVRGGAGTRVTVTVPAAWRTRVAVSWGNAQHSVFHTLHFPRCGIDSAQGNAYAGGFFIRREFDCVPLRYQVGARSKTLWFGVGRRCRQG